MQLRRRASSGHRASMFQSHYMDGVEWGLLGFAAMSFVGLVVGLGSFSSNSRSLGDDVDLASAGNPLAEAVS